jgi:pimeloyl-ACP methyl ester carboxylesterase
MGMAVAALTLCAGCGSARAQQAQTLTIAGRHVVIWAPPAGTPAPQPVIVFSHGYGGCAVQSRFLTATLAAHGYFVVAMDHHDANCGRLPRRTPRSFRDPMSWSDATYHDRAEDVGQVLAALRTDPRFRERIDLARVGLVGHSLGGYTVLGLAGAWPSWRLPGVRAVLALSPYDQPYLAHRTLGGLAVPVMYQTGTLDFGIGPSLTRVAGGYDASPAPKYLVEFRGYGHFAWTNLRTDSHEPIADYSVAFLDHYVRGLPAPALLTHATSAVSQLRFDSDLGRGGTPGDAASAPAR